MHFNWWEFSKGWISQIVVTNVHRCLSLLWCWWILESVLAIFPSRVCLDQPRVHRKRAHTHTRTHAHTRAHTHTHTHTHHTHTYTHTHTHTPHSLGAKHKYIFPSISLCLFLHCFQTNSVSMPVGVSVWYDKQPPDVCVCVCVVLGQMRSPGYLRRPLVSLCMRACWIEHVCRPDSHTPWFI